MNNNFSKKELTKKTENLSSWYQDVIAKAELADYSPVKGCMIIRPYGYSLWENIQKIFDEKLKKEKISNAYFPLFIPESFLKKEKDHVEGFSPVTAVVTIGGGEELKEKLVVRPTSETIMYTMFAKWIKSWRDLPLKINQWCNVVRWEKRTYLFLRTTEFLWQEGHTVHQNHQESSAETERALKSYIDLYRNYFAVAGIAGKKSQKEKFAGALNSFSYEILMPDGKALQSCTSHDLGQNFAKVFKLKFLDKDGKEQIPWQTSWGFSTRSIGALIMNHGDDNGLIFPPQLAPVQVVILPITKKGADSKKIIEQVTKLEGVLSDLRIEVDWREEYSLGWKINHWEMKGVPLRLEIGEREINKNSVVLVRRDNFEKKEIPVENIKKEIRSILEEIQKNLLQRSEDFLNENTKTINDYSEFKKIMSTNRGFIKAFWCENSKCEEKIKNETKATTRCLSSDSKIENGKCIFCGEKALYRWVFAQSY